MKKEDLLFAINDVEEAYLEETAQARQRYFEKKKPVISISILYRAAGMAAAFFLVIAAGRLVMDGIRKDTAKSADSAAPTVEEHSFEENGGAIEFPEDATAESEGKTQKVTLRLVEWKENSMEGILQEDGMLPGFTKGMTVTVKSSSDSPLCLMDETGVPIELGGEIAEEIGYVEVVFSEYELCADDSKQCVIYADEIRLAQQ